MKYDTDLTAVQVGQAVANLLRLGERTVCVCRKKKAAIPSQPVTPQGKFSTHKV